MNNQDNKTELTFELINQQLDELFKELSSFSKSNIKRILLYYTAIGISSLIGLKGIYGKKNNINPQLRVEASQRVVEQSAKSIVLFMELFKEFNLRVPMFFSSLPDPANFEEEFQDFLFDILNEIEPMTSQLRTLYGFNGDEKNENFGLIYEVLYEGRKITNKEHETIRVIVESYKRYYELLVNEIFRPIYQKIKEKEKNEILKESTSTGRIVNFFKKWRGGRFSELLEGLDPFVRNALTHTQKQRWTFLISKQVFIFKDADLKNPKQIHFREFLFNYLGSVEWTWNLVDKILPLVEIILKQEKSIISYIQGEEQKLPNVPRNYVHPVLEHLVNISEFLKKNRLKIEKLEGVNKLSNEIIVNLLKLITFPDKNLYTPLLFRYCVSNYPYEKPREFKLQLCKEYLRIVPLKLVRESRRKIVELINSLNK
ncbi:MAG: hypothetical protein ACTSP3_10125 [Candidatus Heimdallarchaeaceae archaeon]